MTPRQHQLPTPSKDTVRIAPQFGRRGRPTRSATTGGCPPVRRRRRTRGQSERLDRDQTVQHQHGRNPEVTDAVLRTVYISTKFRSILKSTSRTTANT